MTPRTTNILKYAFTALLTVGLLVIAFRGTDFEKLSHSIRSADYWWIFLMVACLLASHAFRALRWRYLLAPIKAGISIRNLFSGVMIGYFVNNVLPRAGELVRPYALGKLEEIPKSSALGTIVVERILDTASFLFLLAIIPLIYDGPLVQVFPWLRTASVALSAATFGILLLMLVLMLRRDWTDRVLTVLTGFAPARTAERINRVSHAFLDGFLFLRRPGGFWRILLLSAVVWFLYILMTYVAFFAFGLQKELDMSAAVVVLVISSIGVAIPTPGATGGYHWFTAQTLLRLFHVPNETALGYATVTHAVGFISVSIIGACFLFRDHVSLSDAMSRPQEQSR